jgi:hypothetical protein
MNLKVVVAILLVAAVPMYAHAQNPRVSEGDAEKVATIISGDKIKTRAYCDIHKLAKQVTEANEKKDGEKVNELLEEIETLEKTLGPEYVALIEGIQDIGKTSSSVRSFRRHLGRSSAVYEVSLENPNGSYTRYRMGCFRRIFSF